MPPRRARIVTLENVAREVLGMPVLRPAGRHFDVSLSDRATVSDSVTATVERGTAVGSGRTIQLSGSSHGFSTTTGTLTFGQVSLPDSPANRVGYLLAVLTSAGWVVEYIVPGYGLFGGLVAMGGAALQLRRWHPQRR